MNKEPRLKKVQILLKTGSRKPGETITVDDSRAKAWITDGIAKSADAKPTTTTAKPKE